MSVKIAVAEGCILPDGGAGARVGAGAVVVSDVPPGVLVYGNPAKASKS